MPSQSQKLNIICLSNQLWDYPLWTNKRHVMSRMSRLGHNVLFVDPPINTGRVFLKHVLKGEWSSKRLVSRLKKDEGVLIFSPLDSLPMHEDLSAGHAKRINKICKKFFDPSRKTVLWVYNVEIPGIENYLNLIKYDLLVYDCVDNYSAFPRYDSAEKKKWIANQEQVLVGRAKVVFASAPGLVDKLKKYNENVYYMPNVGDYERFKDALSLRSKLPDDIKNIPEPRIGFTGAVDEYKFDKELFKKTALDYPGYSFVIIGPLALKDKEASKKSLGFEDLSNVYLLETKPYTELVKYVAGFEVAVIPYQINDYTVGGCFPVKFHEELAAGLPVVVTDLPAYAPFDDVCYISKSYNEFSHNIRRAIEENSAEKVKERKKVAKGNTWDGKVSNMLKIIGNLL
jgi:glycosyltransferase involved in cell wall biosynthesis